MFRLTLIRFLAVSGPSPTLVGNPVFWRMSLAITEKSEVYSFIRQRLAANSG